MPNDYWKQRSVPYKPGQTAPFKVSRSKIELFMQCPRCFWLDVRLKVTRPSSPPFNINKAIDELFKKEFDSYRAQGKPQTSWACRRRTKLPTCWFLAPWTICGLRPTGK
jgi:hypothetical protein